MMEKQNRDEEKEHNELITDDRTWSKKERDHPRTVATTVSSKVKVGAPRW